MQLLSPPSGATTAALRRGHTRTPSGVSNISIESEMSVSTTVSDEAQNQGQSVGVKVVLNGDDTASEVRKGGWEVGECGPYIVGMSVSTTVSDENQGGGSQGGQSGGVKVVLNGDDTASEVRVGELYYG